jgi:ribosomal protein S18 acetylase RimI-like enzyme
MIEGTRVSLEAIPVSTSDQVETLRRIRNATAMGFSHDNTQISETAQRAWWVVHRHRIRVWLYYHSGVLVGFGMLRQTPDGAWWNSLGVLPKYQGRGFGSAITADLLEQHDGVLPASVRQDNHRGIAMHRADAWERVPGDDPALVYFRSRARD